MTFNSLEIGQRFKVTLGKSFETKPKKKAQKFFNVKNTFSTEAGIFGQDAKLEKTNDKYQVEMKHTKKPNVVYDVQVTTEEEFNCILIYNEETKTFTLERQSAQINLLNRKLELPVSHLLNDIQLPATPQQMQTPPDVTVSTTNMELDDFDFDISKDMDAILDSDDSDKEDEASESDVFEEIEAPMIAPQPVSSPLSVPVTPSVAPNSPSIPMNLALPTTPIQTKKRKLKMASAPIRHPGTASPLTTAPAPKRLKSESEDESLSSGSEESSSGSESGSTETESSSGSESESDSDDDDFESLAQDISMSLSKGGPSAPASPQQQQSLDTQHVESPSQYKPLSYDARPPTNNGNAGPMSLRALFKEDEEEESLSSSDGEDDSD